MFFGNGDEARIGNGKGNGKDRNLQTINDPGIVTVTD
jgi:hypothetical protein